MIKKKVKAREVIQFGQCLSSVIHSSSEMHGIVHYLFDKNIKNLEGIASEIEEGRISIIKSYAEKDKDDNLEIIESDNGQKEFVYKEGNKEKAIEAVNQLMEVEYEIVINQIPLSQYSEIKIEPKNIANPNILFDIYIDENK